MTLTLENISPELDAALRRKAAEQHKPVDEVAVDVLKIGLGLSQEQPKKMRDLSDIAGTWVDDPAFDEAMNDQDRVDPEKWR